MFIPLGLEDSRVDRIPVVSICLALACVAVSIIQLGVSDSAYVALNQAVHTWIDHPALIPPAALEDRLPAGLVHALEARANLETIRDPEQAYLLQQDFERQVQRVVDLESDSFNHKWGFVPGKGLAQIGLVTSLFLHFGFMHIAFNLLFFYMVGPFLEDSWGRPLFALFYITGGIVSVMSHTFLDPNSLVVLGGASGAVAACMGAFASRFAARKVRLLVFIFIFPKTFSVPGWLWSLVWFGGEVLNLANGEGGGGVAVMAHIGGWLFGFGFAWVMSALRIEERFIEPKLSGVPNPQVAPRPMESQLPGLLLGATVFVLGAFVVVAAMPSRTIKRPTGTIEINSSPQGASIFVNGQRLPETTPYSLKDIRYRKVTRIQVAQHSYRSEPALRDIVLSEFGSDQRAAFTMVETRALQVSTKPPGARVLLDKRPVGTTPGPLPARDVGAELSIEFTLPGHMLARKKVTVRQINAPISVQMEPSKRVRIESTPSNAKVSINGEHVATTPEEIEVAARGRFKLRIEKPGFRTVSRRIKAQRISVNYRVKLRQVPLSSLPLDPAEREQLKSLRAEVHRIETELKEARRALARVGPAAARGDDIYGRVQQENSGADLQGDIEMFVDELRSAKAEIQTLIDGVIERLSQ